MTTAKTNGALLLDQGLVALYPIAETIKVMPQKSRMVTPRAIVRMMMINLAFFVRATRVGLAFGDAE